ncbi:MAG: SEFIR domain-containing protein [Pseudonocardiaceae bacterium]
MAEGEPGIVDGPTSGADPVRVFVSYAHDDAAHKNRVREFWTFLRTHGIDARLDKPAAERRQDWPLWMLGEVRAAEFVLVVASPAYRQRAEGEAPAGEGRGVQFEAALIRDEVYADREAALNRFLPVVLPGCAVRDIPAWLGRAAATLAVAAYLAEIRPLIPATERAWILVADLELQTFLSAGDLSSAVCLADTIHQQVEDRAVADPTNTAWQRDLPVSHERLGDLAVAGEDLVEAQRRMPQRHRRRQHRPRPPPLPRRTRLRHPQKLGHPPSRPLQHPPRHYPHQSDPPSNTKGEKAHCAHDLLRSAVKKHALPPEAGA